MSSLPLSPAQKLETLRTFLKEDEIDAFIVPSTDCHNSEYAADHFKRRQYISNFTGSAGTAVITATEALLWTDARYFIQAERELDPAFWTLMKLGLDNVPSIPLWIKQNAQRLKRVSADPMTLPVSTYKKLLPVAATGQTFVFPPKTSSNYIDRVWATEPSAVYQQPALPMEPIVIHPLALAGKSVEEKISGVRHSIDELAKEGSPIDAILLTETPDTAWLFNLRGNDFEFNPMFLSFTLLTKDFVRLYCHPTKLSSEASQQLATAKVDVREYLDVFEDLKSFTCASGNPPKRIMMDETVNTAAYNAVADPDKHVVLQINPVKKAKAKKNDAELAAFREAHIQDAVALCTFLHWMEMSSLDGSLFDSHDERSVADYLDSLRYSQPDNVGLSFPSISSMGENGAMNHYTPPKQGSKKLFPGVYLIDSGGHYRGATTDVTRTIHLGSPSPFEKQCWTRALKCHICLGSVVFPKRTEGPLLDTLARRFLWDAGLNFRHGTGHGVGAQLSVHEGPCGITPALKGPSSETPLEPGMILSNEPGVYIDGDFGVRHENLVEVVEARNRSAYAVNKTSLNKDFEGFLAFENLTLVPFQQKFLDVTLLSDEEVQWLNQYHQQVWNTLSPRLSEQPELLEWLKNATRCVSRPN